jgi:hypothetical protein
MSSSISPSESTATVVALMSDPPPQPAPGVLHACRSMAASSTKVSAVTHRPISIISRTGQTGAVKSPSAPTYSRIRMDSSSEGQAAHRMMPISRAPSRW